VPGTPPVQRPLARRSARSWIRPGIGLCRWCGGIFGRAVCSGRIAQESWVC